MPDKRKVFSSITPKSLTGKTTIKGVVIGVIPHLNLDQSSKARRAVGLKGKIDLSAMNVPEELSSILKDDEVVYLVVGKWPPATPPGKTPDDDEWLKVGSDISDALRHGLPINLVVGPWPIGTEK